MAMPVGILKDKQQIIKEREGERLARYLRILFGKEKFGFKWSSSHTSYTDGKDVYILYELQRPDCRPFSAEELRVLRKGHSIHERGHIEYDVISDYLDWQKEWMSKDRSEWLANEKYPLPWLQFFGNMMMDGRMENFTAFDHPTTQEYLDFGNYEWRFGIRGSNAGEDRISDFRECFMSRVLGMTDIEGWDEEAVALVESVQSLIDDGRVDKSTFDVLCTTTLIMKRVWPTLIEWMELSNEEPDNFDYSDDHADSQWGDSEEVEVNANRVYRMIAKASSEAKEQAKNSSEEEKDDSEEDEGSGSGSGEGNEDDQEDEGNGSASGNSGSDEKEENGSGASDGEGENEQEAAKPEFSNILRLEEKNLEKDEKEAEEQVGPYEERTQVVTIHEHREDRKAYSTELTIMPLEESSLDRYNRTLREVKRFVAPIAKALSEILDPVLDQKRRNQRSGKLKVNRAWRTETLQDANVFERRKKGTPAKDARVLILNDISGSTGSRFNGSSNRIIDEMRKAQTLLIEACEAAKIPVSAFGFTEFVDDTVIFPFKPFGRFSNVEKGFIGGFDSMSGNRDTVALQWAVDELAKYNDDIRLLLMLSDGEPCFSAGEDYDTMRSIVQQAEKRGIDVLCLYVGPQNIHTIKRVQHMYPGRSLIVSKHLSRELSTAVKRIIRKRR